MNREQATKLLQEIRKGGGDWERLKAKCNWEKVTPIKILMDYGHPKKWEVKI